MRLNLTNEEFKSPLWVKIETQLKKELEILRRFNDMQHDEAETNFVRGRIANIKDLLHSNTDNKNT